MKLEATSRLTINASYHGDRGTYSSVMPTRESRDALHELASHIQEGEVTNIWDLHSTVMWSSGVLSTEQQFDFALSYDADHKFSATPKEFVVWNGHDDENYLVLLLTSTDLVEANLKLQSYGLTANFDYNPHITFAERVSSGYDVSYLNRMLAERKLQLQLTGIRLEDAKTKSTAPEKTEAKLITAAGLRVPDGNYSGIWSGYVVRFAVRDAFHEMHTKTGIRGRSPVMVRVKGGQASLVDEAIPMFGSKEEAQADVPDRMSRLAERSDPFRLTDRFMDLPLSAHPGKDGTCVGSGVLFCAKDTGRVLFVKRSMDSDAPGTWCCLGGGVEVGETVEQGCRREVMEEGGFSEPFTLIPMHKDLNEEGTYAYHNHFAFVPTEFTPVLNDEHTDFKWSDSILTPCHPGLLRAIKAYQDARSLPKAT